MGIEEKVMKTKKSWCDGCVGIECKECIYRDIPTKEYYDVAVIYMPPKYKPKPETAA
jgi:hypothetical protein